MSGQTLGRYRVDARLGAGGMGTVYRAWDPELQRPVAIKVLEPRKLSDEGPTVFSESPFFTPDGRGLVYSSNRGGATNIWFRPLGRGSPVQLTTGAGPDESPSAAHAPHARAVSLGAGLFAGRPDHRVQPR